MKLCIYKWQRARQDCPTYVGASMLDYRSDYRNENSRDKLARVVPLCICFRCLPHKSLFCERHYIYMRCLYIRKIFVHARTRVVSALDRCLYQGRFQRYDFAVLKRPVDDRRTIRTVSCKSNFSTTCFARHVQCCKILKHVLESYDNRMCREC